METAFTIWTNIVVPPAIAADFERQLAPHRVIWSAHRDASNLAAGSTDASLVAEADIAIGQPNVDDLFAAKKLKLFCLSSAGYTRYDRDDLRDHCRAREIVAANASSVYAEPCAQHAMAMLLSMSRNLTGGMVSQFTTRGWPYHALRKSTTLLDPESKILIVGYGAIARRLVELLSPYRPTVTAFRRKPAGDENCPTLPIDQLDGHLPTADHVVNILPASQATERFFDEQRFARFKQGATFLNIGRGDTVDQDALIAMLDAKHLAGAYLDVTSPEPLPPDHPLWTTSGCYITPHTAGGTTDEVGRQVSHFVFNVKSFARGEGVVDRIF